MKFLNDNGVEARTYYPIPLHLQECLKMLGHNKGDFPETERATEEAISIPVDAELTTEQKAYVVAKIKEFFA